MSEEEKLKFQEFFTARHTATNFINLLSISTFQNRKLNHLFTAQAKKVVFLQMMNIIKWIFGFLIQEGFWIYVFHQYETS